MSSINNLFPDLQADEPKHGWKERMLSIGACPILFLLDWFHTRNWLVFLAGLPAALIVGATAVVLLIGRFTPVEQRLKSYNELAQAAMVAKDTAAAEVYYRRMTMWNPSSSSAIYGLAIAAAEKKDYDQARSLMQKIAPEDAAGFPPAHLWLAKDRLRDEGQLSPDAERSVEHHLTESLQAGDDDPEVHALLGSLYAKRGDAERAIPHLLQVSSQRPDLQLMLAVLYEQQKNTTAARASASRAREFFRRRVKVDPKAAKPRVQLAQSEALLGNYAEAVRILQEGLTAVSDPKTLHSALVDVYLWWYGSIREDQPDSLAKRLELLNAALVFGPENPVLMTLLADLSTRDWDQAAAASGTLEQLLARGTSPATVHAILGTRALQRGDLENAAVHLEQAYLRNPQMPAILNNLAWALANREKPDLDRALQLAQAANKLSNHPEISATIGTILARQGKHQEAVKELETALRAFPDRASLHERLADLYKALGDVRLEESHRQLAKPRSKTL